MDQEKINKMVEEGYACSQFVLGYYADRYGLDPVLAKKVSAAFESGQMQGNICGAVNGAYMVLGLEYSSNEPESRQLMIEKVSEFNERFTKEKGSIYCKDLLGGLDISTDEGMSQVLDQGLLESVCFPVMVKAVEILGKMLKSE